MTEREFQKAVIRTARQFGWKVWHFHDSRRSIGKGVMVGDTDARGFPDLVLVHPGTGRILFRELKSDTGRMTVAQVAALADLSAAGADASVWRPRHMPVIVNSLSYRPKRRNP
jgi:hypothetical protein